MGINECKDIQLVSIDNPFVLSDKTIRPIPWYQGMSLGEIISPYYSIDIDVRIYLNNKSIPLKDINNIFPKPGDSLTIIPEFHGGGNGGKMVLKAIMMIGIAIISVYTGGLAASLFPAIGAMGQAAVSAGVMMVGGLLVNALIPITPESSKIGDNTDSSVYSWGPTNTQSQGVPVPRYYGVNKLYGNIISSWIETEGDDQFYYALVCQGIGPVKSLTQFQINDQPIGRFENVLVTSRRGFYHQTVIPKMNTTKLYYSTNVKIAKDQNYVYTTTGDDFDGLSVDIYFPQGVWKLQNDEKDGAKMIWHEVPYQVKVRKVGDTTWIPITNRQVESGTNEWVSGSYWSLGQWVNISFRNTLRNDWLEVQRGESSYDDPATGLPYHENGEPGDSPYEDCTWQWKEDGYYIYNPGTPTWVDYNLARGRTSKPIRKIHGYQVPNNAHGQYEVLINRTTSDSTNKKIGDDMYFAGVREIIKEKYTYPGHVLNAVSAKATEQLSGSLRFSCMSEGAIVRWYDADDEEWKISYSNNPAWVAWDIVTQPVITGEGTLGLPYAINRYLGINPSRLDFNKWLEWANYCNAQVDDGNGGTEKRITFNGAFDYDGSMWEALLKVCSIGNAVPIWNGSNLTLAIDKEETGPFPLWSVGDISEGSFSENFLPMEERATEIEVDFVNAQADYQRDKLIVYQPGVDSNGFRATIDLFGVTSPSEAWRAAMRRLMYNKYVARSISVRKDIEALNATIGDVVNIQHDVPQWGVGGRIVSATTSTVTFDREVTILSGYTYKVLIRSESDVVQERTVTTGAGTYTTVSVSVNFNPTPAKYDVYAFGQVDTVVRPFRITGLRRNNDLTFDIEATEYRPECYQFESNIPAFDSRSTQSLLAMRPREVTLDEMDFMDPNDGRKSKGIRIDFTPSDDALYSYVEIWHKEGNAAATKDWTYDGTSNGTSYEIVGLNSKTRYTVTLIPVNTSGRKLYIGYCDKYEIRLTDYRDPVVFRSDDEPTEGMISGDRWVDTNDSNKMYWYDGSEWVAIVIPDVTGLVTKDGSNEFWSRHCEITWDEPDIATGEAPPYDLIDHYQITVKTLSNVTLRTEKRTKAYYTYSYDKNKTDHAKLAVPTAPSPSIKFRVSAVDLWGNISANYIEITATAPIPVDVLTSDITIENSTGDNRTKKGVTTEISWTDQVSDANKITMSRIKHYVVRIYNSSGVFQKQYYRSAKTFAFEFTPTLQEQVFGTIQTTFKVGIVVQDVFGQTSSPQLVAVSSSTVPAVSGLALKEGGTTFTGRTFAVVWNDVVGTDFPDSRFKHYLVKVYNPSNLITPVRTVKVGKNEFFRYDFADNEKDFRTAVSQVVIGVTVVSKDGGVSTETKQTFTSQACPYVRNLSVVNTTAKNDHFEIRWDNAVTPNSPYYLPKTRFSHYAVRVYDSTGMVLKRGPVSTHNREVFRYTRQMNEDDFGTPAASIIFGVVVVDVFGQESTEQRISAGTGAIPTISGLSVKGGGTTFIGTSCDLVWSNVVSSAFTESRFSHYVLEIKNGATVVRTVNRGKQEHYVYTYSQNVKDFGGTGSASFNVAVRAYDIYGNAGSAQEITVSASTVPAISGLSVKGGGTTFIGPGLDVVWNDVVSSTFPKHRFSHYFIVIKLADGTWVRDLKLGKNEHFLYKYEQNVKDFGGNGASSFILSVLAVDVFGTTGTYQEFTFNASAVPQVANLKVKDGTTVFTTRDCDIVWDDVVSSAFPRSRFSHYLVEVVGRRSAKTGKNEHYTYRFAQNWKDGSGSASRSLTFNVYAVDIFGNQSTVKQLVATNAAPSMASFTPVLAANLKGISVRWDTWIDSASNDEDVKKFAIYCDTFSPPTTVVARVAGDVDSKWISLTTDTTYYVKIVPYDVFGVGTGSIVASTTLTPFSGGMSPDDVAAPNVCARGHAEKSSNTTVIGYTAFHTEILWDNGTISGSKIVDKGIDPGDTVSMSAWGLCASAGPTLYLTLEVYDSAGGILGGWTTGHQLTWTSADGATHTRKKLEAAVIPSSGVCRIAIIAWKYSASANSYYVYSKWRKVEKGPKCTVYQKALNYDLLDSAIEKDLVIASSYSVRAVSGYVRLTGSRGMEVEQEVASVPSQGRSIDFVETIDGSYTQRSYYSSYRYSGGTNGNIYATDLWNIAGSFGDGDVKIGGSAPYLNTVSIVSNSTAGTARLYLRARKNGDNSGTIYLQTQGEEGTRHCYFQEFDDVNFDQQIKSSLATGTAPLSVVSTTVCANLNTDRLDGYHESSFVLNSGRPGDQTWYGSNDEGQLFINGSTNGSGNIYLNYNSQAIKAVIIGIDKVCLYGYEANIVIGDWHRPQYASGAAQGIISVKNIIPPTVSPYTSEGVDDRFYMFSSSSTISPAGAYVASGQCPTFMTSRGNVIKLFRQAHIADPTAISVTFATTYSQATMNTFQTQIQDTRAKLVSLLAAIEQTGLLGTS